MEVKRMARSGSTGWCLLAGFVIAWDFTQMQKGESLSSAFNRATKHPMSRWPVTVAWLTLTLHLFARLPQRFDPFHQLARLETTRRDNRGRTNQRRDAPAHERERRAA